MRYFKVIYDFQHNCTKTFVKCNMHCFHCRSCWCNCYTKQPLQPPEASQQPTIPVPVRFSSTFSSGTNSWCCKHDFTSLLFGLFTLFVVNVAVAANHQCRNKWVGGLVECRLHWFVVAMLAEWLDGDSVQLLLQIKFIQLSLYLSICNGLGGVLMLLGRKLH